MFFRKCLLLLLLAPLSGQTQSLRSFIEDRNTKYKTYGYKSGSKVVIAPRWDWVEEFSEGLAVVQQSSLYGVINEHGKYVVPMNIYSKINSFSEGFAAVNKGGTKNQMGKLNGGKWGVIDSRGKLVIPMIYDDAGDFHNGLVCVSMNNKYGYIDRTGKTVIPFKYDYARGFSEGMAEINIGGKRNHDFYDLMSGGLYGYINLAGKEVIPPIFVNTDPFIHGIALVQIGGSTTGMNGKYRYIDKTGKTMSETDYDLAENFSDGLAAVNKGGVKMSFSRKNGKWGFINEAGKLVIQPVYDKVYAFNHGTCVVGNDLDNDGYGKYGLIDKMGKEIVPIGKYEYIMGSNENPNLFWYRKNKKEGLMDATGKELTEAIYDFIFFRKDGTAEVSLGKNKGLYDNKGKLLIPAQYSYIAKAENGYIHVIKNVLDHGYYDTAGTEVIPAAGGIDTVFGVQENILMVQKSKMYGFADMTLKRLITQKPYESATAFTEGLAGVSNHKKWGFIDKTGKEVIPLQYDNFYAFSEGLAAVNTGANTEAILPKGGKWGFIDKTGKKIIPNKYDDANPFSEGLASVNIGGKPGYFGTTGGKWGYVDKTGKEVILPLFDQVTDFANGQAWVTKDGRSFYIDKTGKEIK